MVRFTGRERLSRKSIIPGANSLTFTLEGIQLERADRKIFAAVLFFAMIRPKAILNRLRDSLVAKRCVPRCVATSTWEKMPKRLLNNVLVNAIRLLVTLGIGLWMIRLVAGLGQDALALYLMVLAWRWIAMLPGNIAETVSVPLLARAQAHVNQKIRRFLVILLVAAGLASGVVLFAGQGRFATNALAWGLASSLIWGLVHTVLSPKMAGFLIAGQQLTYTCHMALRRGVEVVCLLAISRAIGDAPPDQMMLWFFQALSLALIGVMGVGLVWPVPAITRQDLDPVNPWVLLRQTALLAVSGQFTLRLPVIAAGALVAPAKFVTLALIFVLLGYLRQLATVLLIGLDGLAARLGPLRAHRLLWRATAVQVIGIGAAGLTLAIWLPEALAILSPYGPAPLPSDLLFARLMLVALVLRAVTETWVKIAVGRGSLDKIAGPVVWTSVGFFGAVVLGVWVAGAAIGLNLAAGTLLVGQLWLVIRVLPPRIGLARGASGQHGDSDQHSFDQRAFWRRIGRA